MTDPIGDISTKWDEQAGTVETRSWVRSDKQFFRTGYRSEFMVCIDLERITVDMDGNPLGSQFVTQLIATASKCASDPRLAGPAARLQTAFTELTGLLYEDWKVSLNATAATPSEPGGGTL